jgi:hypothetical protein
LPAGARPLRAGTVERPAVRFSDVRFGSFPSRL